MPAICEPNGQRIETQLRQLGKTLTLRRKDLKLSSVTTAEAAGISRMTLHRIERGESSVTLGAYLNVISSLGLTIELNEENLSARKQVKLATKVPKRIPIVNYPQLKSLAWQLKVTTHLSPKEALNLYERNWRHVELSKLTVRERELIQLLSKTLGRGALLV